jgi:hypothetical protein
MIARIWCQVRLTLLLCSPHHGFDTAVMQSLIGSRAFAAWLVLGLAG